MDELKKHVGRCFGIADGVFAGHPIDEKEAKRLRKKVKGGVYSWEDVEFTIYGTLAKRGCTRDHIGEQVAKAKKFFGIV